MVESLYTLAYVCVSFFFKSSSMKNKKLTILIKSALGSFVKYVTRKGRGGRQLCYGPILKHG